MQDETKKQDADAGADADAEADDEESRDVFRSLAREPLKLEEPLNLEPSTSGGLQYLSSLLRVTE